MAYVLGYIFADGSIYKNPNGYYYLEFTSTDRELIEKVRTLMGSNHKIGFRKRSAKNPKWKDSYRLQISARDVRDDLARFGVVQNKSLVMEFPEIPRKYFSHFLRGYFDGDGNVNFGRYWRKDGNIWRWVFTTRFISGSKSFLLGLHKFLAGVVKGGFIYKKNRGYELTFSTHDGFALFDLMYHNTPAEMFLKRKHDIFLKAFEILNLRA
ncbi:MAG: LAGLIDADG family homing endonuclease [Candidatus Taylorbacteria bacterium]|nr:LAGLIDADG family homing endonuclease [Candidatus Taylorbacteria bacterium]